MGDLSEEETWTLTTERIAQVLADVRKTPCPRSAHCPDDVSRVQFALHIIAEKALEELLDRRAAQSASAEQVRSVVREAIIAVVAAEYRAPTAAITVADAIADRVVSQLGPVGLSEEDRKALNYLFGWCSASIGDITVERTRFERGVAALDRLLTGSPAPIAPNDQERAQLADLRRESVIDDYPAAVQYIDRLLGATP